ncbi:hypothetical protein K440DRAFT_588151 [Wilcoxina mikolae CBS 423.85]|nr:hypothetical protein K440DRAFT_588151 [Wilcoxina mikolae CBS 423.85]
MTYSDSDSPLSSPPESADEAPPPVTRHVKPTTKRPTKKKVVTTIPKIKLKAPALPARSPSPPPKQRQASPAHVYTLADSPELAFIVMFRSRFADAFKGVPNLGCQDIERGIVDSTPSEQVEQLLCRLVSLVLNRKKPVERGHHNRALEEAVHAHQSQWPKEWGGKNPMPGGRSFGDLDTNGRLVLLKALINWALVSSEQIRAIIAENYKGSRSENDLDCPLSVQPWGKDGQKRKYWLIEGKDDTPFRLYREANTHLSPKRITWINIAGTIDEIRKVAKELEEQDGTKHALLMKQKIETAILRFEEGEKRRQKREYRATRKAMFSQPSGMSLYEGRTRGKRIKYTFSDNDDDKDSEFDDIRSRHSARSARPTPAPDQPRFTASGRQIRRPQTGAYGETKINGSHGTDQSNAPSENGSARPYNLEDYDIEAKDSGADEDPDEWKGDSQGDDDEEEDADDADYESEWDDTLFLQQGTEKRSLRIILKVNKDRLSRAPSVARDVQENAPTAAHDGSTRVLSRKPNGRGEVEDVVMKDADGMETLQNGHSPPARNGGVAQAV